MTKNNLKVEGNALQAYRIIALDGELTISYRELEDLFFEVGQILFHEDWHAIKPILTTIKALRGKI